MEDISPATLQKRLDQLAPLLDSARNTFGSRVPAIPSVAGVKALIGRLREPLERRLASGDLLDVWSVAGIGRDEVKNAAVVAWLCNPLASHGLGASFANALLHFVDVTIGDADPSQVNVVTEHRPLGSDRDRIDITIELPGHLLFIEVKVHAAIGDRQLERYKETAEEKAHSLSRRQLQQVIPHLIFLAPKPAQAIIYGFQPLSWRQLATILLQLVRTSPAVTRVVLSSFARHVAQF